MVNVQERFVHTMVLFDLVNKLLRRNKLIGNLKTWELHEQLEVHCMCHLSATNWE